MPAATKKLSYHQSRLFRKLKEPKTLLQIGEELRWTKPSVDARMRKILKKTGFKNRVEILANYIAHLEDHISTANLTVEKRHSLMLTKYVDG